MKLSKYLGEVIDKKLSWLRHLEHLEKKVELLLIRIRTYKWTKQELELQEKMKLYNNVFLPTITCAYDVWFNQIKCKKTHLNFLRKIKIKFVKAMTCVYKQTSNFKLLRLVSLVDIVDEVMITKRLGD